MGIYYALGFCSVMIALERMNDTVSYIRRRFARKKFDKNWGTENFRGISLQKAPRLNTAHKSTTTATALFLIRVNECDYIHFANAHQICIDIYRPKLTA